MVRGKGDGVEVGTSAEQPPSRPSRRPRRPVVARCVRAPAPRLQDKGPSQQGPGRWRRVMIGVVKEERERE
jgi:hypothetical protein